jgi:hypothetical protein
MAKSVHLLVCVSLVLISATMAWSSDLAGAPWRGQPGTTLQEWKFGTDANPATPEVMNNPYGMPTASISVSMFGAGWLDQLPGMGTQTGYWDLGEGNITLNIANTPFPLPYKEIYVQVTYYRDINQAPSVTVPTAQFISGKTLTVETVPTGGAWMLDQSIWRIEPNPTSEQVIITGATHWGSVVDQVVVDTICAPEPASLALLGVAGTMMLARRRWTV